MSEQARGYDAAPGAAGMMIAGIVGGLAAFLALILIATTRNGGAFEYALDDVYIHLTMRARSRGAVMASIRVKWRRRLRHLFTLFCWLPSSARRWNDGRR